MSEFYCLRNYLKNPKSNPIHVDPIHLAYVATGKQIVISPKADGIYRQISVNKQILIAEYIEPMDIYLVFDTMSYPVKNANIITKMNWIYSLHDKQEVKNKRVPNINNLNDLQNYITEENKQLQKYVDEKIKWYPKLCFVSNFDPKDFLQMLDTNINAIYPTDGWIIYTNNLTVKYKPKEHLTIDLLLSFTNNNMKWLSKEGIEYQVISDDTFNNNKYNNMIFRCYWVKNTWIAKELRYDKHVANDSNIINKLQEQHVNNWTATDLIELLKYNNVPKVIPTDNFKQNMEYILDKYEIVTILDLSYNKIVSCLNFNRLCKIRTIDCISANIENVYEGRIKHSHMMRDIKRIKNIKSEIRWFLGDITKENWQIKDYLPLKLCDKYDLVIINDESDITDLFMTKMNKLVDMIYIRDHATMKWFAKETIIDNWSLLEKFESGGLVYIKK